MRKRKTTQKAAETIKTAASKAADGLKEAQIPEAAEKATKTVKEKAAKIVEKITDETPDLVGTISSKAEEIINSPMVEEGKEALKDTAEKAMATVRTRISDVTLEIFETSVSLDAIQKAVKKEVSDKKLKGEIRIYVNAERRAAYYTVNGQGSEAYKIDLKSL